MHASASDKIIAFYIYMLEKSLTIRITDFNLVANNKNLLNKLRELTLEPYSGMNHELDSLLKIAKERFVGCKIITAHHKKEIVGWALYSKETSNFFFPNVKGYSSQDGILFQLYVDPMFRKNGIGSALMKIAKKKIGNKVICIAPWDYTSEKFFSKFYNLNCKKLCKKL